MGACVGQLTYLLMLGVWAGPVIALQWAVGHRKLRARWRVLIVGTALPTAYLCAADVLAIRTGIWHFNPERTLNLWLGGLPVEEGLFFLITNLMVVQGILLTMRDD